MHARRLHSPSRRAILGAIVLSTSLIALPVAASLAREPADAIGDSRTWTDRSGQHRIEARLAAYRSGQVTLRRDDATEIVVPLSELSSQDQRYVRLWQRDLRDAARDDRASSRRGPQRAPRGGTQRLYGVDWHGSPEAALAMARGDDRPPRPVMWFRVLGDLSGFM